MQRVEEQKSKEEIKAKLRRVAADEQIWKKNQVRCIASPLLSVNEELGINVKRDLYGGPATPSSPDLL